MFSYLHQDIVHKEMIKILNAIREELQLADETWKNDGDDAHTSTGIVTLWDRWVRAHFMRMTSVGNEYIGNNVRELRRFWVRSPITTEVLLADIDRWRKTILHRGRQCWVT